MKIWIFNNYNMLPEHGALSRSYYLGKYLKKMGHEPTVFVGSHPHNTNLQLISGKERFKEYPNDFPWVLVKTCNYEGSKVKRVFSMFEYIFNLFLAVRKYEKPDVIIGSSAHPLAAVAAIVLSKIYRCKSIVEIRDLWPESIVAYRIASAKNPLVLALRRLEHWMYVHCDKLVFLMEGAYDYIVDQGWEKDIPRSKVHFINNGVDLEEFNYNLSNYFVDDLDLLNNNSFKVVYTGSVRLVNNLGIILDVAKNLEDLDVVFLIWGTGDELEFLKSRVKQEKISNVLFKGKVDKKYIPYIVSHADLNFSHFNNSPLSNYGISFNKMFEYFASGKPILFDFISEYSPAQEYDVTIPFNGSIEDAIKYAVSIKGTFEYEKYCENAIDAAKAYSYENLTSKLLNVILGE